MTENEISYWAFLSYSQQDNCEQRPEAPEVACRCWGSWLHNVLKNFSIPTEFAGQINARAEIIPERIEPIFQDHEEQPGNASLSEPVRQALEQSKCLIVVCSPHSAQSLHVNEAVRYFKQLGRGNRILPLVVAGEPHASDGQQPDALPSNECFVPALRHPVKPDGMLDNTRRERGFIYADARHGNDKRELSAEDHQNAETTLEIAKIQLIAGLLGVGFNGLWERELKRRLVEAPMQAREAQHQLQEARNEVREAQHKVLAIQNLPPDVQNQIEEAQNQARAAQSQLTEARNQAQETQNQLQALQRQLEEARNQARLSESKVLEAQQQLEAARHEVCEAKSTVLALQHLPQDVQSQLEAAQNQAQEAQKQAQEFQNQARASLGQVAEARDQARAAQNQVQEAQQQLEAARAEVREAQRQVFEIQNLPPDVKNQLQEAQKQVLEAQHQVRTAQSQVEEARNQARAAQNQVHEIENQTRQSQIQLEATQCQARAAESKFLEAQQQAREALNQVEGAHQQVREAQNKIQELENQTRAAQSQVQQVQNQGLEAQNQARAAQNQLQELQNKNHIARRLTKVFAVMAVLAVLAASTAWWQRQLAVQALAKAAVTQAQTPTLTSAPLNREQIQQALQEIGGARPNALSRSSLEALAARIPTEEFPATLKAASVIVDGRQRRHFQEQLLDYWMKTNLPAAFDWSFHLTDADFQQHALENIIPILAADQLTNTLARINELKPAPGEQIYTQLFQRWAAINPLQAIEWRQQTPGHDASTEILSAIMMVWVNQQPEAALSWLKSQPDSESLPVGTWRNTLIADLFNGWAAKDLEAATIACQQLPDDSIKEKAWERVLSQRIGQAPVSAAELVTNLRPGDYRQKSISDLCQHWSSIDAPVALAWAQSLPIETERATAVNQVVAHWAHQDPPAAAQMASQQPELSGAALGEIATAWFQRDFTATTNWVASLPDGENKQAALAALSVVWAQNDPKSLAAFALGLPTGDAQTQCLNAACRQLARYDLPGAVELLQPISDATLRRILLEQVGQACPLPQLEPAAKYIAAMPAGEDQLAATKGLLSSWTPTDPEATVNWLIAFPETNSQPALLQAAIKAWSQPEPAAVAKWLAHLPAGAASEELVSAFLAGAVAKYPAFAGQWTQSVTNETLRAKFQTQVARQWLATDPAAALKWIESLNLPEEIISSLKTQ